MRALPLILALAACNGDTADGAPATTGSVAGWVCLGPFGSASAGARVSAFSDGHLVSGEAAADGSFELDGVAVGSVEVVMTNRVEQRRQRVEVEKDRTTEIGSACVVNGGGISVELCLDGSMAAEAGTAVRLDYLSFGGPQVDTVHGATDAAGEVAFSGLTPGSYRLTVTTIEDAEVVSVEPGQTVLFVDPGCYDPVTVGTISGRICNPIDGEPVADVPVEVDVTGESEDRETTTDEGGRFRFDAVPPGTHTVTIRPPLQAPTDISVTVNAGETKTLPDACGADDSGSVAGTVCDPADGVPEASVQVRLDISGEPARFATTSVSGYFRFETVPAGSHQLTIPLPAATPRTRQVVVAVNEEAWVTDSDCNASALGSVSGRVCNPADGEPVADIPVDLEVTGESVPRTTETDTNGNFSFAAVPPGDHQVVVRPPLQQEVRENVTVIAGNDTAVPSPQCGAGPPPDPATLTGVACVGIDSFHALAGATVVLDFNPGIKATFSGTDGAYTLSGLNAGDADVTISRGAFTTTFAVTLVADQTLDLGMSHCVGAGVSVAVVSGDPSGPGGTPDDIGAAYADLGLASIVDSKDGTTDAWITDFMSAPANLQAYDVVVINSLPKMDLIWDTEPCGLPPSNDPGCATMPGVIALESLDSYLQGGGAVYISDWAYEIVRRQFQYYIDFYGNDFFYLQALCGDAELTANASVLDESLAMLLGAGIVEIEYEEGFEHWAVIDNYASQPNSYLVPFLVADIVVYDFEMPTSPTCDPSLPTTLQGSPLVVATPVGTGGGRLVFNTFRYNVAGGTNQEIIQQILLEL